MKIEIKGLLGIDPSPGVTTDAKLQTGMKENSNESYYQDEDLCVANEETTATGCSSQFQSRL